MIPKRLELRNFLAYRAPEPIVFEGIELACLTGRNGVGKSSILDAITWALWGQARAKRDESLIHLGQNEMSVQLDFEQEGLRYRVLRRRARAGRGSRGALDLMVWGADDLPRIISEDGIRQTQDKIIGILRMDYETFVHSAFLQQGRADAFTLKTAAERKRILSEILGLEQWTVYEDAVKERLNGLATQIDIIKHEINRIENEGAHEPELQSQLDAAQSELAAVRALLNEASEQYSLVANSTAALQRERENQVEQGRRIESRREDVAAAAAEIARQEEKIADYARTIEQGESIEAGYQQLLAAREGQSALAEQLAQKQELDARHHQLEGALAEKRAEMMREADVLRERISGLENVLAGASAVDVAALQSQLSTLKDLDAQRDERTKLLQKSREQRSACLTRLDALRAEGTALNERLERLSLADGAQCPLCGQALTASHRDAMLAQLEAERDTLRADYSGCREEIHEIDAERESLAGKLEEWALQLKDLPALQQQLGVATEQTRAAAEAENTLQLVRHQLGQWKRVWRTKTTLKNYVDNWRNCRSSARASPMTLIRTVISRRNWRRTASTIGSIRFWNSLGLTCRMRKPRVTPPAYGLITPASRWGGTRKNCGKSLMKSKR